MNNIRDILDQRGKQYGSFLSHAEITQQFKAILHDSVSYDEMEADELEAIEMILHKIARLINGNPHHVDSWVDIAGYATLVSDRLTKENDGAVIDV